MNLWIFGGVLFVFLVVFVILGISLYLRRRRKKEKKDNQPVDFLPILLEEFFKKAEVIHSALLPPWENERRYVVMKLIFKGDIPENITLRLPGLVVRVDTGEVATDFRIVRSSVCGNIMTFELRGEEDLAKIFQNRKFISLKSFLVRDPLGRIIYPDLSNVKK